jgi:3-phosphoshikimate 1-carboxyvinyltransferase
MSSILVKNKQKELSGVIQLTGSKSLSNRALIIQSLCKESFDIEHISDSDDTRVLKHLLERKPDVMDVGHAGTTFRFLTAWLSMQPGSTILTGSERMKERPVKNLVDALLSLGANIRYLEKEGYPPLEIGTPGTKFHKEISIAADTSSQFISALMMIAPALPEGLAITLQGRVVSRPYIDMTAGMMRYFGAEVKWDDNIISVSGKPYKARDIVIEADWSAASYYYVMAALSNASDLRLTGLKAESMQGDSKIADIARSFGVQTSFYDGGIRITKDQESKYPAFFERDFTETPDLAQGIAVMCAGAQVQALFSGLETLYIKETDRVKALSAELSKTGVLFHSMPARFSPKKSVTYYMLEPAALNADNTVPEFETYGDHRMAMAFACLGMQRPVVIKNPEVVTKSYPAFWSDLEKTGFEITSQRPNE